MSDLIHPTIIGVAVSPVANRYPVWESPTCATTDPEAWYEQNRNPFIRNKQYNALRKICAKCPMLRECFNYAVHHESYGFWGGTTPKERETLRAEYGIMLHEVDGYEVDKTILKYREQKELELQEAGI